MGSSASVFETTNRVNLAESKGIALEEVDAVFHTFQKYGHRNGKPISKSDFAKVMVEISKLYPNQNAFKPECVDLIYDIFDSNRDGKIDPLELLGGVAVLVKGDLDKKADLVFQSMDKDGNGSLSRQEVTEASERILKVAGKIAERQAREEGGLMAQLVMKGIMTTQKERFAKDMTDEVFKVDTNFDNAISLEEWRTGARSNKTVQLFLDPFSSAYMIKDNYLLKNAPLIPEHNCPSTNSNTPQFKIGDQVIVSIQDHGYEASLEEISPEGWHLVRLHTLNDRLEWVSPDALRAK